jgi:hypothetical protein
LQGKLPLHLQQKEMDMNKFGALVLVAAALGMSAVGCGSSACDDYKQAIKDCCDKIEDQAAKDSCNATIDQFDFENADADACQAALDAYKCPI